MHSVAKKIETQAMPEAGILGILAYFSIFKYPLSKTEIFQYMPPGISTAEFEYALSDLLAGKTVFRIAEFYSLVEDNDWVRQRREGNRRAEKLMSRAFRIGRFLSMFPFVRGVGISGSLSKMYADEKADIDFFIVTKTGRLWISRTIMHMFKKLTFLAGWQRYFCMNYYADEQHLEIEDHNIFTAIETMTVIPVCGEAMNQFFDANHWVADWFSGYSRVAKTKQRCGTTALKRVVEWALDNGFGERLDNYLVRVTERRWNRKARRGKRNVKGKQMALLTGKRFAISNPGRLKENILLQHKEKLMTLARIRPDLF